MILLLNLSLFFVEKIEHRKRFHSHLSATEEMNVRMELMNRNVLGSARNSQWQSILLGKKINFIFGFFGDQWKKFLLHRNPMQLAAKGYLMVRVTGRWFPYCADGWEPELSATICITFGYKTGNSLKVTPPKSVQTNDTCSQVVYLKCA